MSWSDRPLMVALAAALAAGCTGNIGDRDGRGGAPPPGSPAPPTPGAPGPGTSGMPGAQPGPGPAPAPAGVSAAVAPLRRLTATQYRNTVRDLLGLPDAATAAAALPADDTVGGRFYSNVLTPLQGLDLDKYATAAEAIAARAVANLGAIAPCDRPAVGDAGLACARRFIQSFGKRAYRRPTTAAEAARLEALYLAGGPDHAAGLELVIAALLQSPKFLYLPEPTAAAPAGKVVAIDPWAMASRLSYFLTASMPDDELFAAAESGALARPEETARQAARLMRDRRFRDTVVHFHQQWLQLGELGGAEKDVKLFPTWTPALKTALAEESRRFIEHVFGDAGDRRLDTLLGASFSFLDGPLYEHYGVPAAGSWQRVELPREQRAGILTQAGLLATLAHDDRTSYILRGKMVREAIFCAKVPDPPGDIPPEGPLPAGTSARERAAAHRNNPSCAVCHELFDPIGFAFESYDPIGRHRTRDAAGAAIDTRVSLTGTTALDGPVAGPVELARKLASADEVRDCVARQWMRFALGRDDAADDAASLAAATRAFREASGQLPELLTAVARSDAFRHQRVSSR
jgi:hypothetical protein